MQHLRERDYRFETILLCSDDADSTHGKTAAAAAAVGVADAHRKISRSRVVVETKENFSVGRKTTRTYVRKNVRVRFPMIGRGGE